VAGPWLNPGADELNGYVSELAARDQPYAWFFQGGDVLAGVLAAAVGLAWLRVSRACERNEPAAARACERNEPAASRGLTRSAVLAAWAVLAFGVATAVDGGIARLDCAP
jgi:hypothetical protein